MGVINNLLGRLKLYADPSVTTQTTTVVQSNTTNSNLALVPNGTGAIVANIPDGGINGGNTRGTYSVDLQLNRNAATQVASGGWATIVGGFGNTASANASIAGGDACTASGLRAIAFGQSNIASSNYSGVLSGQSNTASTNSHATVVGGNGNTASGAQSIAGGLSSTASGTWAVALGRSIIVSASQHGAGFGYNNNVSGEAGFAGGRDHTVSGQRASALGNNNYALGYASFTVGELNRTNIDYAVAIGQYARSYLYGQFSSASGTLAGQGDGITQQSILVARRELALSTGGTLVLSLDGTGTTNLIIPIGNTRAWNVQINTIAIVSAITGTAIGVSVGDTYSEVKNLLFKKVSGTSSIVGTVDTSNVKSDTSMSACALTVTAGASQEMALTFTAPTFTGGGTVTCRVVSKVMLTEVAY